MRHENVMENEKKPGRGRSGLASSKGRRLEYRSPWPDRREP